MAIRVNNNIVRLQISEDDLPLVKVLDGKDYFSDVNLRDALF